MQIKIGVAALIMHPTNKILLGKRTGAHGAGSWAPPGGHLHYQEEPAACAIRETKEECGLVITNVRPGPWTNDIFTQENKHYISLFMLADYQAGEPQILEPDKCVQWQWFHWHDLPSPLFVPLQNLLELGWDIEQWQ